MATIPLLTRLAAAFRGHSLENPAVPLSAPNVALMEALGAAGPSATGITVTEHKAMALTAVYAAVRVIAESLASLPLVTYRRDGRGRQRATAHPVYRLLHDRPNPEMTAFQFIETMTAHAVLTGNAYAEIEWNGRGNPVALWPIPPERVTVSRVGGVKQYRVALGGSSPVTLGAGQVLHVPGLGYDGLVGHSPIRKAATSVSVSLAAEEFAARFYGNGSRPGGLLTYPGKLSTEAKERLKASWEQFQGGLSNSHRVALLEEGMAWQQTQISPDEAQFLETRRYQTTEIARLFRVPPHLIGDLTNATFTNIEQQSLEFVIHTLRPWARRWEQVVWYELFSEQGGAEYFAEFLFDALLRGDLATRYQAYATGHSNGWLSANDIREKENLNPLPGDQGDLYLVPLNMVPADQLGAQASAQAGTQAGDAAGDDEGPAAAAANDGARSAAAAHVFNWREILEPVFTEAGRRVAQRVRIASERAAKRGVATASALEPDHEAAVARIYLPPVCSMVAAAALAGRAAVPLGAPARQLIAETIAARAARRHTESVRAGTSEPMDALPVILADLDEFLPGTAAATTPPTRVREESA